LDQQDKGHNRERDQRSAKALREAGWRVLIVWECSLKGPGRRPLADVVDSCVAFIKGEAQQVDLAGLWPENRETHRLPRKGQKPVGHAAPSRSSRSPGPRVFIRSKAKMCGTAMRGAVALPGSKATSRAKGSHRKLGGPRVRPSASCERDGPHREGEEP
jgi:hypothetical protein